MPIGVSLQTFVHDGTGEGTMAAIAENLSCMWLHV